MVSVLVASAVVTFYDLYMISLFLEHGLGINQRGFQLGIWCCHRTGAELETRVAIRFFVRMVSVLFSFCCRHFLQFDFDLTVSRACLRHHSTRISIRNTVVLLDWRRIGNSCRNPFFCDDGKCFCCFCRCHFLQFIYDLTVSRAQLRYHSTQNLMRRRWCYRMGGEVETCVGIRFFVTMVSVLILFCPLMNCTACLMHQSIHNRIAKECRESLDSVV